MPIVVMKLLVNWSSEKRSSRQLLPTPGDGGGEERSLILGTFLEVTGGAEARDGVRGSAREVNDEHTRGRTAVSDEQQLDQVVVLLAAGPHLGARVAQN